MAPVVTGLPTLLTSRGPFAEHAEPKKMRQPFACAEIELPEEMEASASKLELVYKNTFLAATEPMSPSLRPFYRERSVQTCPGAHVGRLQGLFCDGASPDVSGFGGQTPLAASPAAYMPPTPCHWADAAPVPEMVSLSLADMLAPPPSVPPCVEQRTVRVLSQGKAAAPWQQPLCSPPSAPPRLLISAGPESPPTPTAPAASALATGELPSVGSALHGSGQCKPCAFLHSKGCENGLNCQFCHVCDADERRRRRQAKLELQRAARKPRL